MSRALLHAGQAEPAIQAATDNLADVVAELLPGACSPPEPRHGDLKPGFLGILPTRGCNLACRYCGFVPRERQTQVMDLGLARDAINWYLDLVHERGDRAAEIHFFGGEPFYAPEVVEFCVHYARIKARELGLALRFEVATNGVLTESRAEWLADTFDDVILSLDGPAEIQNEHRPHRGGQETFETVARTATILSDGPATLALRACVTAGTVDRMPDTAAWMCEAFRPAAVCFEPVQPPAGGCAMVPSDAWRFARRFVEAAEVLEACGVEPVYTTADIRTKRVSFCPVGSDTVIVSPDGALCACYLLPNDWQARGLDLSLGTMTGGTAWVDPVRLAATRALNVCHKAACRDCFCRWHCAGGCHVHNELPSRPGAYSRLCVQTRIIALRNILRAMGEDQRMAALWRDEDALRAAATQESDSIEDGGWTR